MKDLLALAAADPGNDAPRRVWADAVGGARGELVQVQCELARIEGPLEQRARLRRRERELLLEHGVAFAGLEGLAARFLFRRGFVEWASVNATVLVERGEELLAAAPLINVLRVDGLMRNWTVKSGDPVELAARVISHPIMKRVRALSLQNVGTETWTDADDYPLEYEFRHDETIALLVKSGLRLNQLEAEGALSVFHPGVKSLAAIRALLDARVLAQVENLVGVIGLAPRGAFPQLSRLVGDHCQGLPATVRELSTAGLNEENFSKLVSSPAAPFLRRLHSRHGPFRDFSVFTSLRSLDLSGDTPYRQWDPGVPEKLTASPLPSLRELRLPTGLSIDELRSVARAFGPRLELLDLRGQKVAKEDEAELVALVAGEVRFGAWAESHYPLLGTQTDGEPWIGATLLPVK